MATISPQLPRARTIHWDDPGALAEAGQTMSGRDFLDAILRGELPPNHPFRTMANVLATPHIGYVSRGLYETFYQDTVANIRRWIEQSSIRERNQ